MLKPSGIAGACRYCAGGAVPQPSCQRWWPTGSGTFRTLVLAVAVTVISGIDHPSCRVVRQGCLRATPCLRHRDLPHGIVGHARWSDQTSRAGRQSGARRSHAPSVLTMVRRNMQPRFRGPAPTPNFLRHHFPWPCIWSSCSYPDHQPPHYRQQRRRDRSCGATFQPRCIHQRRLLIVSGRGRVEGALADVESASVVPAHPLPSRDHRLRHWC